jgi:hypothetical protein
MPPNIKQREETITLEYQPYLVVNKLTHENIPTLPDNCWVIIEYLLKNCHVTEPEVFQGAMVIILQLPYYDECVVMW